ncbi:hypothetical protein BDZ45DRAFT_747210 [Acephala macrosclerotiorum]|nr:hypothetical protein BDZ45DRAFT_747210 [Acephala macrosclerotiorum]
MIMTSIPFKILLLLLTFLPLVLSAALLANDSTAINKLTPMRFKGKLYGVQVELNSTAEQIHEQFRHLHPEVAINLTTTVLANHKLSSLTVSESASIEERQIPIPYLNNLGQQFCCPSDP